MNYRNLYLAIVCTAISSNIYAQINVNQNQRNADQQIAKFRLDSLDYQVSLASQLFANLDALNEVVYSGRDYNIKQFGLTPGVTYRHKSGVWGSLLGYYFSGIPQKWAKMDAIVGYATRLDDRLSASFSYSKWFYFGRSESELRYTFDHFMTTFWTIDLGWMGVSPQAYYMIGKSENVVQLGLTLSKYYEYKGFINKKDKILFNPNATAMLSSVDRRQLGSRDLTDGKVLRIISYDLNIPVTYRRVGQFDITPTLIYTIPMNLLPNESSYTKPFFYFALNAKYLLWRN